MKYTRILLILFIGFLAVGCGSSATPQSPVIESTLAPTDVPAPTEIPPSPTPEMTAAPTATLAPVALAAQVNAATLNMRTGPSTLHGILNQYQQGDPVTIIGAAPGREWLKVIAKDKKTGWMYLSHLTVTGDVFSLPVLPINESLAVAGKVVDANGNGIQGIQIGLTRVGGATVVRVDGISLADGSVFIYAPVEYQGTWLASVINVDCKSALVDSNCRYGGKFYPAEGITLKLPQDTEVTFTYK